MRRDFEPQEDVNEGDNIVESKTRNKKLIKSGFLLELKIDVTLKLLELGSGKMIKNMIKLEGQSTRQKLIATLASLCTFCI